MQARPSNADLQRQIYGMQTESRANLMEIKTSLREINSSLSRALEQSASHETRLIEHEKDVAEAKRKIDDEVKAREGLFTWTAAAIISGLGSALLLMASWALNLFGKK